MSLLNWRDARPEHRRELCVFTCTTPPIPKSRATNWQVTHPKLWEFEAQQMIRALEAPGAGSSHHLRVGEDDEGLAAVSYFEFLDGPAYVDLIVGGIATRLRGKGGGYADEMMEDTLDVITVAALGARVQEVRIEGRIFEENHHSQEMCRRAGFRHTDDTGAPGVQIWSLNLLLDRLLG